jgi:hypothetical protein
MTTDLARALTCARVMACAAVARLLRASHAGPAHDTSPIEPTFLPLRYEARVAQDLDSGAFTADPGRDPGR